jgi:hypothetical protein
MKSIPQFEPFEKIPRFFRNVTITEKIDGTNASIHIVKPEIDISHFDLWTAKVGDHLIWAGSRTRWITPDNDNFGFAKWVANNAEELVQLGVGTHRGEWWGNGIQRHYNIDHKRFSLFNTHRWCGHDEEPKEIPTADPRVVNVQKQCPSCCHVVPVIYKGLFLTDMVKSAINELRIRGSFAVPGFMKPEGIVIYHEAANVYFKATLEKDEGKHS